MSEDAWILVGVVGAPHGVRGEVRLKSYTGAPMGLAAYPVLWAGDPPQRRLTLAAARPLKDDMLVVRFEGVDTRDAAQAITNTRLFVARSDLPPTEEDEFYHADLIGLEACGPDGAGAGRVVAVPNFGAGDLLEIAPPGGESFYVPFTRAFVPTVDLGGRRVLLSEEALASAAAEPEGAAEPDDAAGA